MLAIHAPRKQKFAVDNHVAFMNKALFKEIITRTRLPNKFLKERSEENKKKYSKQWNYCVSLLRKSKSEILMKKISMTKKTCRSHPSILAMREVCNKHPRLPRSFSKINREEILRKILKLQISEVCQDSDIPTKLIKENVDIFADVFLSSFNDSFKNLISILLKNTNITPAIWVGFLGICFAGGRRGKITPCLKLVKIMVEA